jgi:hypothetical protein
MRTIKNMNWWIGVVGVWVVIAPFLLGYRGTGSALWNDVIVGVAVVILAVSAAMSENENTIKTMGWITAVLGLWLVLAPFILGYSAIAAALWSDIIAGVVILILSVWAERELPRAIGHAS